MSRQGYWKTGSGRAGEAVKEGSAAFFALIRNPFAPASPAERDAREPGQELAPGVWAPLGRLETHRDLGDWLRQCPRGPRA